tara:strand:- start:3640 stop:3819 length:180 start_codon:yes stop_codon:yes gene_type:complete
VVALVLVLAASDALAADLVLVVLVVAVIFWPRWPLFCGRAGRWWWCRSDALMQQLDLMR